MGACLGKEKKSTPPASQSNAAREAPPPAETVQATTNVVKPKIEVSERDKAVLDLKVQRDKLNQYKKRMEISAEKDTKTASELLKRGEKDRALLVLKRKRLITSKVDNADNMLLKLEELVSTIETSELQKGFLDSVAQGNNALKQLNEEMKLDEIEVLMDNTQEQIQAAQEIQKALEGKLSIEDEEFVENELAELQAQVVETEIPSAPDQVPAPPEVQDDKEQQEEQEDQQEHLDEDVPPPAQTSDDDVIMPPPPPADSDEDEDEELMVPA